MAGFHPKRFIAGRTPRTAFLFAASLGFLVCLVLVGVSSNADGKSSKRTVLGASKSKVTPNCGAKAFRRACIAEGNVTGFQSLQSGVRGRNFVVPYKRGKVVAWSITLSNPTRKAHQKLGAAQRPYFNRLFGSPSKARISVLRQVQKKRKGPPRYRLIRAGGTQILNPYFGTTVKFALNKPLNVIRGDVVALTIPTWAPAFWVPWACNARPNGDLINARRCAKLRKANTWRASRGPGQCGIGTDSSDRPNEALKKSHPQQKVGSVKRYACYYDGGRLLYSATVVAK